MAFANQEAQRFNHEYLGTEHMLLGLVREGQGVGPMVLKNLGLDLHRIRLEVEKLVVAGQETTVNLGALPKTPRVKMAIDFASEEAKLLNHNYIGTEHILLGLIREHDSIAAQVLKNLEVTVEAVREGVLALPGVSKSRIEDVVVEKPQFIEGHLVACELSGGSAVLRVDSPTGAIRIPSRVRITFLDNQPSRKD